MKTNKIIKLCMCKNKKKRRKKEEDCNRELE